MKTIMERKEELLTSRSVAGDIRLFLMSFMTLGAGVGVCVGGCVGVLVGVCVGVCVGVGVGAVCVSVCVRVIHPDLFKTQL